MTEPTPSPDDPIEIEALLAIIDERDAEIVELKARIRFLEFTPEHAAERIKHRAHATAQTYDPKDGPRGNMGQLLLTHEETYEMMRTLWPTLERKR